MHKKNIKYKRKQTIIMPAYQNLHQFENTLMKTISL